MYACLSCCVVVEERESERECVLGRLLFFRGYKHSEEGEEWHDVLRLGIDVRCKMSLIILSERAVILMSFVFFTVRSFLASQHLESPVARNQRKLKATAS